MYKSGNTKRNSVGDRFIPRRINENFDLSHYQLNRSDGFPEPLPPVETTHRDHNIFVNSAKYMYNKENYQECLWSAMLPRNKKILNFSPISSNKVSVNKRYQNSRDLWPVRPRSKPLINPPSLILDMPDLDTNIYHHVVDWSKTDYVATIFKKEVHLWHPEEKLSHIATNTNKCLENCVKWNKEGTLLAMALKFGRIGIWECERNKIIKKLVCTGKAEALEWTFTNCLIGGTSDGDIFFWSSDYKLYKRLVAHQASVINVKLSCNEKYLVSYGLDYIVCIWRLSEFELHKVFKADCKMSMAWHPWAEHLLVVADRRCISMLNMNTEEIVQRTRHVHPGFWVDAITFNPLSAELVVSYFNYRETNLFKRNPYLTVLKNLNTIVDEVQYHTVSIPYLLWNHDGTKLATVGADENLCIWNFFGTPEGEKRYKKQKKKLFSTNPLKTLDAFGPCIR